MTLSSLVASSLLLSNLYADKETVFVGSTLGGGSGTVSISDSTTAVTFTDSSGLLFSFDAGLGFSIPKFENLELVAGVGYDIHVVNNSDSTDNNGYVSGSWNMTSLNVNFGARYNF